MKKLTITALNAEGEKIIQNVKNVIEFKTKKFRAQMKQDITIEVTDE